MFMLKTKRDYFKSVTRHSYLFYKAIHMQDIGHSKHYTNAKYKLVPLFIGYIFHFRAHSLYLFLTHTHTHKHKDAEVTANRKPTTGHDQNVAPIRGVKWFLH